jgi:tetratricopeptide (TPR) repeat protein
VWSPHLSIPRAIELPASVRPLIVAETTTTLGADLSLAARYESTPADSSSRIVEVSATPEDAAMGLIREPGASGLVISEPPPRLATLEPRSIYGPTAPMVEVPPPVDPPLPDLAPRPTFDTPAAGEPAAGPAWSPPSASPNPQAGLAGPPSAESSPAPSVYPSAPEPAPVAAGAYPAMPAPRDPALMQPVAERAAHLSDRGFAMAHKGMLYAARAELIQALQLVAQALDVQTGTAVHAAALANGLTALEEAGDFRAPPGQAASVIDVGQVALGHRTPLLKDHPDAASLSPVVAQQQYLAYSQAQLALAVGNERVASHTLYRLGKLEAALAAHDDTPQALHGPQAMVFHQAALSVDGANYLAANELGVLLARYGQLAEARKLLVHSVSVRPQVETWHNLAVVHRRLGEEDLAKKADYERSLLAKQAGPSAGRTAKLVRWVDPGAFAAATTAGDVSWPDRVAPKPVASQPKPQRR